MSTSMPSRFALLSPMYSHINRVIGIEGAYYSYKAGPADLQSKEACCELIAVVKRYGSRGPKWQASRGQGKVGLEGRSNQTTTRSGSRSWRASWTKEPELASCFPREEKRRPLGPLCRESGQRGEAVSFLRRVRNRSLCSSEKILKFDRRQNNFSHG